MLPVVHRAFAQVQEKRQEDRQDDFGKLRRLKACHPQVKPSVRIVAAVHEQDGDEKDEHQRQRRENHQGACQAPVIRMHQDRHRDQACSRPGQLPEQEIIPVVVPIRRHYRRGAENHQGAKQHQAHHGAKQNFVGLKLSRHKS